MRRPGRHRAQPDVADGTDIKRHVPFHREPDHGRIFDGLNPVLDASNAELFDRFTYFSRAPKFARVAFRDFACSSQFSPNGTRLSLGRKILVAVQINSIQLVPRVQLVDDGPQLARDITAQHAGENAYFEP